MTPHHPVPTKRDLNEMQAHVPSVPEQEVLNSDMLIPRLLLMQGISPLVTQRKAQLGEIVRSTTEKKIGDVEHPVEIIPLKITNTWTNYELVGTKPEFRSSEPRNPSNEKWDWKFDVDGQSWQRKKTITLFALIPSDIAEHEAEHKRAAEAEEAPDLGKTVMPVVITFQSTSFKWAGKKCADFFGRVQAEARRTPGLAPFWYILPLQAKPEKGGKGSYFVFDLGQPQALKDKAVKAVAGAWFEKLMAHEFKTDDTGEVAQVEDGELSNEV